MSWFHIRYGVSCTTYPTLPYPQYPAIPCDNAHSETKTKTLSTFGNLIENKSRKTGKPKERERETERGCWEGGEGEGNSTDQSRRFRSIYALCGKYLWHNKTGGASPGAWQGSTGLSGFSVLSGYGQGLRACFRVVATSTTRRVVKFEFATAK